MAVIRDGAKHVAEILERLLGPGPAPERRVRGRVRHALVREHRDGERARDDEVAPLPRDAEVGAVARLPVGGDGDIVLAQEAAEEGVGAVDEGGVGFGFAGDEDGDVAEGDEGGWVGVGAVEDGLVLVRSEELGEARGEVAAEGVVGETGGAVGEEDAAGLDDDVALLDEGGEHGEDGLAKGGGGAVDAEVQAEAVDGVVDDLVLARELAGGEPGWRVACGVGDD